MQGVLDPCAGRPGRMLAAALSLAPLLRCALSLPCAARTEHTRRGAGNLQPPWLRSPNPDEAQLSRGNLQNINAILSL